MVFLTYSLVNDVTGFWILFPKLLVVIGVQCMAAFAYSLLFMLFSILVKNTAVGFLISYLFIIIEKAYVSISGNEPIYFIGGILFEPQNKSSTVTIMLLIATIIIFHFLGFNFYRNQDVLSKDRNQNGN
jgi:hypothetical protein